MLKVTEIKCHDNSENKLSGKEILTRKEVTVYSEETASCMLLKV